MSKLFKIAFEEIEEVKTETPEESTVESTDVVVDHQEDAAVVTVEVPQDQAVEVSIEELTEEIGRQEELADGLDALKTIATKVETPTPTDVALFRVAANMAVAGTDEEAQDFIPAIESNKPIDIKGFDAKIKAIKDKIATLKVELAALEAKKKIK